MASSVHDLDLVRAHLKREYAGVYGAAEIEFHLSAHVGNGFADHACQVIAAATPAGGAVLDVGAGYGSFVMLARERGFDAVGTEIAPFEVDFSRRRVQRERPNDDPASVFLDGGIFNHALDAQRFDAVTFWNVLEHIENVDGVLGRAAALLKPGGAIYIICPNYAAWRKEAHYQIAWRPFLSREAAVRRIRNAGKDPRFFETSVFQRTSWEVMTVLRRLGLTLFDRTNQRPMNAAQLFRSPGEWADYYNPARPAVELAARKPRS